jgi:prevent-host-death family protein
LAKSFDQNSVPPYGDRMNKKVTAAELKAHLSEVLDRAAAGEETLITRHGKPVARLAPVVAERLQPRKPGRWKGLIEIPDDLFLQPLDEAELAAWEGAHSDEWGISLRKDAPSAPRKAKRRARR